MEREYEISIDPLNTLCEQKSSWGGQWTEKKLNAFEKYVRAYLTIMNKHRDEYHWRLLYYDGFAGSGSRSNDIASKENPMSDLFKDQLLNESELNVYQGAAERVVRLSTKTRGFDYYYFVDCQEENCALLKERLTTYSIPGAMTFIQGDANDNIDKLAQMLKADSHLKALVLLDPFGMSISWETIEKLPRKSIDLWILLPSGVIINRLLKRDGKLLNPAALERFFGLTEEQIHAWFYERETAPSLFPDMENEFIKKGKSVRRIAELYCQRLGTIFENVTSEPLVMRNSRGFPIFHFVFASSNKTAMRIAQDIIDKDKK